MKFALAFFIIAIHVHFLQDIYQNLGYMLVNGLFRIAVPVFLVVNGYYLCNILERGLFTSWLKRILLLYAFWMTAYLPVWAFSGNTGALTLTHRLIFGFHHLWYIAGIAGGGLCIYAISSMRSAFGVGFAIAAFFSGVAIQYAGAYDIFAPAVDKIFSYNWSHRNSILFAFPFMYAGFCMRKFDVIRATSRRTLLTVIAFGLAALSIECGINYHFNAGSDGFDNLLSLALICPALVALALHSTKRHKRKSFSTLSSGIYFIHPAAIHLMNPAISSSYAMFLATALVSVLAAILLTRINRHFPYVL